MASHCKHKQLAFEITDEPTGERYVSKFCAHCGFWLGAVKVRYSLDTLVETL